MPQTDLRDPTPTTYLFDTGSDLGRSHMDSLERTFDPATFAVLDAVDVRPGQRCLDVGAGGGSVVRWLADRVGPGGEVVAVDLDTTHLVDRPGVRVARHDITDGLTGPIAGPYDLIHARFTLLHLTAREEILAEMVAALAPGGWLVIGDPTGRPLEVLAAPEPGDVEVWERIQHLSHHVVGPAGGIDFDWAPSLHRRMVDHGLLHVAGIEHSSTFVGGSLEALVHAATNQQASKALIAAGALESEMERYQQLTRDPAFRAWNYQVLCLRGQRPA